MPVVSMLTASDAYPRIMSIIHLGHSSQCRVRKSSWTCCLLVSSEVEATFASFRRRYAPLASAHSNESCGTSTSPLVVPYENHITNTCKSQVFVIYSKSSNFHALHKNLFILQPQKRALVLALLEPRIAILTRNFIAIAI